MIEVCDNNRSSNDINITDSNTLYDDVSDEVKKSRNWICYRNGPNGSRIPVDPLNPDSESPADDKFVWGPFTWAVEMCEDKEDRGNYTPALADGFGLVIVRDGKNYIEYYDFSSITLEDLAPSRRTIIPTKIELPTPAIPIDTDPSPLPAIELTKSEKAEIKKTIPSHLEGEVQRGGILSESGAKTKEDMRDLALFLLAEEGKTVPEVGKVLARHNKKIPKPDQFEIDDISTFVNNADLIVTGERERLEAEAIEKKIIELIESREEKTKEEIVSPPDIVAEATRILQHGDPIAYHRTVFAAHHSGDREIGDVWLMAAMTQAAITTMGIQPGFTGKKGSGKSSGVRAALHLHPQEYVVDGSFSAKALLYDDDLLPGSVIYSDDTYMDPEMTSMIKRAMTNFQKGIEHRTVNKNGGTNTGQKLTIPPRCCFASSNVYGADDDELKDRQYLISLAPSKEDDKKWLNFLMKRHAQGREEYPDTREVLICREMIRQIKQKKFRVIIPFGSRLIFSDPGAKRDILMFNDFVQASAILHHLNRKCIEGEDGVITVTVGDEDFKIANEIFQASEETRKFKISKGERELLTWIGKHPNVDTNGIEESQIIRHYGMSRSTIRQLLYGKSGNAGIVNMVPGVNMEKMTRESDNSNGRTTVNVITVSGDVSITLFEFGVFATLTPLTPH